MNYTLYVCRKTGTVNIVANCIATVDSNISMLALSLSPAPSSFGHGRFCGAIINNFGLLLIIVDSAWSFPAIVGSTWLCPVVADSTCPLRTGWCLNLLTWPTLKNFLFIRGIWRKRTAHTWLVVIGGIPFAGVTPLAYLQNLHHPQNCCRLGPLLCNSHCPKPVQISGLGTRTHLSYAHSSQTAYWGSPAY